MKKNIFALTFFTFAATAGLFFLLSNVLIKFETADARALSDEKIKNAIYKVLPQINKNLENSDDIALIYNMETLKKTKSVAAVFILDKNNNVIIHNIADEIHTLKTGAPYDAARDSKDVLFQRNLPQSGETLLSVPLAKENTLICVLTDKDIAKTLKIRYYTIGSAAALLIAVILYLLAKLFVLLPFNRTKKALEKQSAQDIKDGKYDEITDIFVTENEKYNRQITALENNNENLSEIIEYYFSLSGSKHLAFIILNSANNIVYAYDSTQEFLKKDFTKDSNILEAVAAPEILKLVNMAHGKPGYEVIDNILNHKVAVVSIGNKESISGTIIKVV
ncbi:hypothetical protein [Endomicrobium proavitum]|uniref:Uncharacterized protein n=1 Tax=Endomicrobium proavitum TaxID=1408281 RepID=A0A0G3WJY7_9BACT|nr:hypothetical protein [Endomicrobium proavitum]AKL97819.1 conserved exported protein of unknown function [Endomicrobium proavitum]